MIEVNKTENKRNYPVGITSFFVAFIIVHNYILGDPTGLVFCLITFIITINPRLVGSGIAAYIPLAVFSSFILDESSSGPELFYLFSMLVIASRPLIREYRGEFYQRIMCDLFLIHLASISVTLLLMDFDQILITNIFLLLAIYPGDMDLDLENLDNRESFLCVAIGIAMSTIAFRESLLVGNDIHYAEFEVLKTMVAIFLGLFFFKEASRLGISEN